MFDWEEGDRYSFEDSERFEEDSLCSWISEPESLCNNWRGWKRQNINNHFYPRPKNQDGVVHSLTELCARTVAAHIPFEVVEQMMPPVPEQLQLLIAFWSFPDNEEDIRLYSCLANGNAEEFNRGDALYKQKSVHDPLQIGFHLSATVIQPSGSKGEYNVAVTFDRGRITTCNCTCSSTASWCSHVVAVCLHRIHQHIFVKLRAPVSESLSRLQRDQLQKFAQYLISELPQQILPTAQRLIDEILSCQNLDINTVSGAPDPTAGGSANEQMAWWLDESNLHDNIHKILVKFCVPSPIVFSDVNYLSSTAPPVASEWASLLRPLRGREPEGMWNLLSIVREMFKRNDRNSIPLLEIITEECLATEKILVWWVNTKVALHIGSSGHGGKQNMNSNSHGSQYACSSLCDEIVVLWRLAALNPALSPIERDQLIDQFKTWHMRVLERVAKSKEAGNGTGGGGGKKNADIDVFPGFKPACEACLLDWDDYPLPGVTYSPNTSRYYCPVMCFRHANTESQAAPISAPHPRNPTSHGGSKRPVERRVPISPSTGQVTGLSGRHSSVRHSQRSSSGSSEGFCDNDMARDSDSPTHHRSPDQPDSGQVSRQSSREDGPGGVMGMAIAVHNGRRGALEERDKSSPEDAGAESDWSGGADHPYHQGRSPERNQENRGAEYELYMYNAAEVANLALESSNARAAAAAATAEAAVADRATEVFSTLKKLEDPNDILFARAEGLHAHGHMQEASCLAVQLAQELLSNPPNLMIELPPPPTKAKRKKVNPASHQITCLASATLAKCAFLCTVLAETPEHTHLSFQVAIFGLEMARPPASTKPLEVKLANQESDLVTLLKRLPLGGQELAVIRSKAEQMRGGQSKSRGEALLPLMLASFLFDALVISGTSKSSGMTGYRQSTDETLGFEAAVAAIGLKANVCEADHPLLCEATRRQRGELALTLLTHYKDDQDRLMRIMDKLLDKEIHQMYKAPSLSSYYVNNAPQQQQSSISGDSREVASTAGASLGVSSGISSRPPGEGNCGISLPPSSAAATVSVSSATAMSYNSNILGPAQMVPPLVTARPPNQPSPLNHPPHTQTQQHQQQHQQQQQQQQQQINPSKPQQQTPPLQQQQQQSISGISEVDASLSQLSLSPPSQAMGGARAKELGTVTSVSEGESGVESSIPGNGGGAGWEAEYKVWEEKYAQDKKRKKHKHSTNVLEPSTPTGESIPVVQHSGWMKPAGPGSDSGSSGNSSDSMVSSSSGDKINKPVESPPLGLPLVRPLQQPTPEPMPNPRPQPPYGKGMRFKGKRAYPTVPNQPSEASSYFMFELAKTVLNKAGGNSSTSLFTQPSNSQNHRGPHRPLHMCAFQIGLYALGLHNCVSPNWLSRTYSSHVSWITSQAVEIGAPAVAFLIETWEGHLTPQEAASIADRASRGRDAQTVRRAACLALSCLPHAHALNPNEIQRAIIQCKEQSDAMLENACLAVEGAAKGGGVYPEVLFSVARKWYEIYETRTRHQARQQARHGVQHQQLEPPAAFLEAGVVGSVNVGGHSELPRPSPMNPPTPPGGNPPIPQQQTTPQQQHPPPPSQQQLPQPNMSPLEPQPQILPPPVSTMSMNGAGAGNSLTGVPGYPVTNAATTMPYGLPGMAYPLQYNYIQNLTSNVSCINPQLTLPMYMAPPGVPFSSPVGISQPLLPPPPMPYYPPVTIPSTLPQGALPGSGGLQVSGVTQPPMGGPPPPMAAQQSPLIQGATPPPQSFYPVAYSGGVGNGSVGGTNGGWGGGQPPLLSWVRAPCSPLATPPHQPQLTPAPTSQPQQQVMMLQGGQGGVLMPMNVVRGLSGQQSTVHNSSSMHYLLSAYRVGMLALETLARRVHDDRPQAKYARNPPYGEDVKWLLGVAKKLGTQYLHQFCMCSVNSVVSPFILQELSVEAAQYLARHSPALFHQQLRSPILQPLVQKCQQMFIQCSHLKMYYITPTDYDEFISIIRAARSAFQMTPGGMVQFNELLQALRRSKSCKKELWQRITTALQQAPTV